MAWPKGKPRGAEARAKQAATLRGRKRPVLSPENPDPPRVCRACERTLSPRLFRKVRVSPRGTVHRAGICQDCRERERRPAGVRRRRVRVNARGDVHCPAHDGGKGAYLPPASFGRRSSQPGQYRAYCRACERELGRLEARRIPGTPEHAAALKKRAEHGRRKRAAARTARREFVAAAISLLRRRGLTKRDISRLGGFGYPNLLIWERQERVADPSVAERLAILLRETAHLPLGEAPVSRRRQPHPELAALLTRVRPQIEAVPVRSKWRGREAGHAGEDED